MLLLTEKLCFAARFRSFPLIFNRPGGTTHQAQDRCLILSLTEKLYLPFVSDHLSLLQGGSEDQGNTNDVS